MTFNDDDEEELRYYGMYLDIENILYLLGKS